MIRLLQLNSFDDGLIINKTHKNPHIWQTKLDFATFFDCNNSLVN